MQLKKVYAFSFIWLTREVMQLKKTPILKLNPINNNNENN